MFIVLLIPPIICIFIYLPETKQNTFVENAALFLPPKCDDDDLDTDAELDSDAYSADNPGLVVEET